MSADDQNGRAALAEDLELTEDAAARVTGGMFPIEPGRGVTVRFSRITKRKKKVARRHYPGGGRPV